MVAGVAVINLLNGTIKRYLASESANIAKRQEFFLQMLGPVTESLAKKQKRPHKEKPEPLSHVVTRESFNTMRERLAELQREYDDFDSDCGEYEFYGLDEMRELESRIDRDENTLNNIAYLGGFVRRVP